MPGWRSLPAIPISTRTSGNHFERAAEKYLRSKGLRCVARNYQCRGGEIDLIMREQDTLVFVEVRYRKSANYGSAAESVTRQKQQKIIHCAQRYIQHKASLQHPQCRFDVVAISPSPKPGQKPEIVWYRDAFQQLPD